MERRPAAIALSALTLAACSMGGGGSAVPGPAGLQLMSRFPDQVCGDVRRPALGDVDAFVDTVGIGAEVRATGGGPRAEEGSVEFVVWYRASGVPEAAGLWSTTLDVESTRAVQAAFAGRVLDIGVLPQAASVRIVADVGEEVTLRTERSVECLPHVRHPAPMGRPFGLPDSVHLRGGVRWVYDTERAAAIRIHVDETGVLTAVDSVAGTTEYITEARRVMHLLEYDPALLDGRPVPGRMIFKVEFGNGGSSRK